MIVVKTLGKSFLFKFIIFTFVDKYFDQIFSSESNSNVIARYSLFGIDGNPCYDGVFSRLRNDADIDCACEDDLITPPDPKVIE